MKIAIGADHGGYRLKEKVAEYLKQKGYSVKDFGTFSEESCDYPLIGYKVSKVVGKKESVEDVEDVGNNDEAVKADAKPTLGKIKNNEKKSSSSSKPLSVGEAATKLSGALSDFFSALFGR